MKLLLLLILSLCFKLEAIGQNLPDSGFTNKAEAKNLVVNGLKEGKWVEYYDETEYPMGYKYYSLTLYKAGKASGIERGYYTDGHLYYIIHYKDGEENGMHKEYYENGKLMHISSYTNGVVNGIDSGFNEDGILSLETPYTKGKIDGVQKWYYENGKLEKEVPYKSGEKDGLIKDYSEDGRLKSVRIDTVDRIQRMIIGTWISTDNPDDTWIITQNTIKSGIRNFCGTGYSIYGGGHPYIDEKEVGKYWFTFAYVACGDSDITNMPDYGSLFSIDSTYLNYQPSGSKSTFVFKKKKEK